MRTLPTRDLLLPVVIVLIVLSPIPSSLMTHNSIIAPATRTQSSPSSNSTAIVAVSPSNITDASRALGQKVGFSVNVINSSALNLFVVRLTYNYNVLGQPALDYSRNILGSDALIYYNCIDNKGSCTIEDDKGVITFGLDIQGNVSVTPPRVGVLFNVTFTIIAVGFSQIHLTPQGDPFGTNLLLGRSNIPLVTKDGFFNNAYCGSMHLCTPPVLDYKFSPSIVFPGRQTKFNVTTSMATNPGAKLVNFTWDWSQGLGRTTVPANVTFVSQVFKNVGNYSVTLQVTYSDGVIWQVTKVVPVVAVWVQLLVGHLTITPQYNVYPGTLVQVIVSIVNNGTLPETSNVTVALEGNALSSGKQFSLPPFQQSTSVTVTWDTTGFSPRVYRLDAIVAVPRGSNSTQGHSGSSFIQLIEPLPTGFALSLAETAGVGIAVVAAIAIVSTRLRKKPSFLDEPL